MTSHSVVSGAVPVVSDARRVPERLRSLDVFRGLTIAAMLLVNNPGNWDAIYPPLRHAGWNGWTPTDLVFPFFLFIVGAGMTFSFGRAFATGTSRWSILVKTARRSLALIAIGLGLQAIERFGYHYPALRIPGILQRIGLAILITAPIVLWVGWRGRAVTVAALLLVYWALLALVPVPGVGAGVLEPGKDLGAFLDRAAFGAEHLSREFQTTDPASLLGTFPSAASVLFGVFAGEWLRLKGPASSKIPAMLVAGLAAVLAGLAWDLVFPINKPLWTSSYAVFTAGLAAIGLAASYWLVDLRGSRSWTRPFEVLGVNAIAVYVLSVLTTLALWTLPVLGFGSRRPPLYTWLYGRLFLPWLSPEAASLAFGLCYVVWWMAVMWAFARKGILIKL